MASIESSARPTLEEASTPVQSKRLAPKHNFEGHDKGIWGFVFLHDNVHIVSGSVDGTMHKWNCDTGLAVGEPWKGEGGGIYALALSPDGKILACGREDGSVQRWTIDGEMIEGVWTGHSKAVWSLSWSPSGSHIASGSEDGTILIRRVESGKIVVGPIKTKQEGVEALAYSPSGERIASGGLNTICIWDTKTGQLVVDPIKDLGLSVTSLVWSFDSTKLYSASDEFARVFDSKSGKLLHRFEHDRVLYSVALSPKHNVLACVGHQGVAQLWDTVSHQPLGQPFHQTHDTLYCVSFSRDGKYVAYGGDNKKLTLWVLKDMAPQLPAPTPLRQRDSQSTQQETRSNSPSLSCLDADATGGNDFIVGVHYDLDNNFFPSSQQSLPSPSPSPYRLPPWLSVRRLWNVVSRYCPLPDESVPQERSKRKLFARRARSDSPLEPTTIKSNQHVPEEKVREGEGEQGDDRTSENDPLSAREDKSKQRDDSSAHLDSQNNRNLWERLIHARGKNLTFDSPYSQLENAPQRRIPRNPWQWNFSLIPAKYSRHPVNVAACRDEDRYGIAPESDEEAAAAMLRTNGDVADSSTRPGRPAVVARPTQT
ncbi:WD40-repeat-containing domain protein [Suillus subaureus]|uniref:WD40-repeat-containing domain protein n=1 Tax=Suillus subaureus TaxID=48587 RepID=A0A9P7EFE1_9AGAM|nr:WD40-repeat-containing domain protein [Suillus subaureus]KAG1819719.1 WD40-repeat-containing domain protein [Suillus subaureus]